MRERWMGEERGGGRERDGDDWLNQKSMLLKSSSPL